MSEEMEKDLVSDEVLSDTDTSAENVADTENAGASANDIWIHGFIWELCVL